MAPRTIRRHSRCSAPRRRAEGAPLPSRSSDTRGTRPHLEAPSLLLLARGRAGPLTPRPRPRSWARCCTVGSNTPSPITERKAHVRTLSSSQAGLREEHWMKAEVALRETPTVKQWQYRFTSGPAARRRLRPNQARIRSARAGCTRPGRGARRATTCTRGGGLPPIG